MSLYTNNVQRNRYHIYVWSRNGIQTVSSAANEPSHTNFGGRRSGYVYKPENYEGNIVGVNTFISDGVPDDVLESMYQGGTPTVPPAQVDQLGQGSCVHLVLEEGGQNTGTYNMNQGTPDGQIQTPYNTPNILCSMGWTNITIPTNTNPLTANLQYTCQGSDPVSNGVFIPGPLDRFNLRLRFNNWVALTMAGASLDEQGTARDMNYFCHLIVQPLLKTYEVPVAERPAWN